MKVLIPALILLFICISCRRPNCERDEYPRFPQNYVISVDYLKPNGGYLLTDPNPLLLESDISIVDKNKHAVDFKLEKAIDYDAPDEKFYRLAIRAFENIEQPEGSGRLYIFLKGDIDTINFNYRIDECRYGFDDVKGTYNNSGSLGPADATDYNFKVVK